MNLIILFHGDAVNKIYHWKAYSCSAATLNYIRALNNGGFASLRAASTWSLGVVPDANKRSRYQEAVKKVVRSRIVIHEQWLWCLLVVPLCLDAALAPPSGPVM